MSQVEAIFRGGVFKPLGEVSLAENQRVRLDIHPVEEKDTRAWLDQAQRFQQHLLERRGCFPDSTLDIATDRARDE